MKENVIQEKSFRFAIGIIKLYKELYKRHEFDIGRQLLRSGTSVGANIEEAIAAQSKRDFLSKINIALKEARETQYWLKLLDSTDLLPTDYRYLKDDSRELISLSSSIVKTLKIKLKIE